MVERILFMLYISAIFFNCYSLWISKYLFEILIFAKFSFFILFYFVFVNFESKWSSHKTVTVFEVTLKFRFSNYSYALSKKNYYYYHYYLTGKPTGKRPLERPRRRWEDNITLKRKVSMRGNWVDSTQDRNYWRALVNAALKLRVI